MEKIFRAHPQRGWNRTRITESIFPADFAPDGSLRG